jgi:hypothetical protein
MDWVEIPLLLEDSIWKLQILLQLINKRKKIIKKMESELEEAIMMLEILLK